MLASLMSMGSSVGALNGEGSAGGGGGLGSAADQKTGDVTTGAFNFGGSGGSGTDTKTLVLIGLGFAALMIFIAKKGG